MGSRAVSSVRLSARYSSYPGPIWTLRPARGISSRPRPTSIPQILQRELKPLRRPRPGRVLRTMATYERYLRLGQELNIFPQVRFPTLADMHRRSRLPCARATGLCARSPSSTKMILEPIVTFSLSCIRDGDQYVLARCLRRATRVRPCRVLAWSVCRFCERACVVSRVQFRVRGWS